MNPFDSAQPEADSSRSPRSSQRPLPPLQIPGSGPPPPAFSPYDDVPGGSYEQYSSGQNRPFSGQTVSFREPEKRPGPSRAGASRESVQKVGSNNDWRNSTTSLNDKRGSATDLPELNRTSSSIPIPMLDPEGGFSNSNANFRRKKSLVRPDRERMDPNHRQWYYRNHAAQMDTIDSSGARVGYLPSTTGHLPQHGAAPHGSGMHGITGPGGGLSGLGVTGPEGVRQQPSNMPPGGLGRSAPLRRGKSILGREEDAVESGINFLKRGVSLRRKGSQSGQPSKEGGARPAAEERPSKIAPGPVGPWMIYCYVLTACCPAPVLACFGEFILPCGIANAAQQMTWRSYSPNCEQLADCERYNPALHPQASRRPNSSVLGGKRLVFVASSCSS